VKEYLAELVNAAPQPGAARNLVREYLQARVLESLARAEAMTALAFHGGTALRFLYALPRFSEDLDFALEINRGQYDFRRCLRAIQHDLAAEGYSIDLRVSDQKVVHSAFVRFPGLLHELAISPHVSEVLAVKIEVDTNPPAGAGLATTIVRRHVVVHLQHHDRASLLAGKLHAILQRPYVKGRDWFDLLWYLSDPAWPAPNLVMLNHALTQTGWTGATLDASTWRASVAARLAGVAWDAVYADVAPFLGARFDRALLQKEILAKLLAASPG
jgi:hypothetical protein